MIKYLVLLSLHVLFVNTFVEAQKEKWDTTFILRENTSYYHAVFIDTDKNSLFHDEIANNKGNPWDSNTYRAGVTALKRYDVKLTKHTITGLPKNWRPLYLYRDAYYVYAPSDWGNNAWIQINDSTFVEYISDDGTQPSAIRSFKKNKPNEFQISIWDARRKERTIKIYIIDAKNGIAVFEDTSKKDDNKWLMVAADNIKRFPVIVNYCKDQKVDELDFDKPDYKKLLKDFIHN